MKMRAGTRVIFTLYILCIITVGVFIILAPFVPVVFENIEIMVSNLGEFNIFTYAWIAAALLFIIVGLCLLFFGIRKKPKDRLATISALSNGTVYISLPAVEELSRRYMAGVDGVVVNSIKAFAAKGSVNVVVDMSCKPETVMQDITAKIHDELTKYIAQYAGINVHKLEIKITPIQQNAAVLI